MKDILASCLVFSLCAVGGTGCGDDTQATGNVQSPPPQMPGPVDPGPPDPPAKPLPTEFLVMRVGTGTAPLQGNVATVAFVERRKISDGSLIGQTVALPTAANGSNRPLTLSGTGSSEGALTRSSNGHYILLAGYDAVPDTTNVIDSATRVIGRIAKDGTVDTSTLVDGLNGSGNFIRSAASPDGIDLWVSGVLGIAYTTLGRTGSPLARPLGSTANSRVLGFYDGQLYVSRASDTMGGLNTVGNGEPTTDNTQARQLPGFPSPNNVLSPYGFVGIDQDGVPGIELLYVADDRVDGNGGVQRWKLNNNSWTLDGTLSVGATSGCRGLAGFVSLSGIVLIASTSENGAAGRLVSFLDPGVPTSLTTAKLLVTAPTSTAFRGVALPPE